MKIVLFFVLLFSVTSAMAFQAASKENILQLYLQSLDGHNSKPQNEQRYSDLRGLDVKVDDSMLGANFLIAGSLASLQSAPEKVAVMNSLVYACLNEATKESVYRKCVDGILTGTIDEYYGKHFGEDGLLDVLIENFFEIQMALEKLSPNAP